MVLMHVQKIKVTFFQSLNKDPNLELLYKAHCRKIRKTVCAKVHFPVSMKGTSFQQVNVSMSACLVGRKEFSVERVFLTSSRVCQESVPFCCRFIRGARNCMVYHSRILMRVYSCATTLVGES